MKLMPGIYKIPEMFPKSFVFPGGYTLVNNRDDSVYVKLMETSNPADVYFNQRIRKGECCNVFLKLGFLWVDEECEIIPFTPEEV